MERARASDDHSADDHSADDHSADDHFADDHSADALAGSKQTVRKTAAGWAS